MTRYLMFTLFTLIILVDAPSWAALSCPKEPSGSTLKAETSFDVATGSGFVDEYARDGLNSYMSIVSNQNGPASAPNALQAYYPVGHPGGNGTGNVSSTSPGSKEFFLCFWVKLDNPFENHKSAGTKIVYITTPSSQHPYYLLLRGNPPYSVWLVSQGGNDLNNQHLGQMCYWPGTCNLSPTGSGGVTPGTWHLFQVYLKQSTAIDSKNGIARVWVDANLPIEYTTLNTLPADTYSGVHINPVFGGARDQYKTQTDYMWFDAMRISDPAGGSGGGTVPPTDTVRITHVLPDVDGATVGIEGPASKLRYWDDTTGQTRIVLEDYVPGRTPYRLVKHWPKGVTFTCVQAQQPDDKWTEGYQCAGVTPGPDIPVEPTHVFSNIINGLLTLKFDWKRADCDNIKIESTGKETRTGTITCVKEESTKKKPKK